MHAEYALIDAAHGVLQVSDDLGVMLGHRIANGIGDVQRGRPGFDGLLDHFRKKIQFRSARIFRAELDIFNEVACPLHTLHRPAKNLFPPHLQV